MNTPMPPRVSRCLACVLLAGTVLLAQPASLNSSDYEITFKALDKASVSAQIPLAQGVLEMERYGAFSQPSGWATFVRDLKVHDSRGRELACSKSGKLTWQVADKHSGRVRITYDVDLSLAAKPRWPDGPRTTGAWNNGTSLFVLAKALFIRAKSPLSGTVRFRLPEGFRVSSPWEPIPGAEHAFRAERLADMINNVIVIGRHSEHVLECGRFTATIVALGEPPATTRMMADAVGKILPYYQRLFDFDERMRYLMVWFRDGVWETGEAYHRSYAAVWPEPPTPANVVIWSDSIAHELLHMWNGHRFASAEKRNTQWFLEGFTEYCANVACVRTGVIARRDFFRLMEKHLLMYWMYRWNGPWKRLSLVEAGSNKSDYNAALYDGGWLAAFCVDTLIRERSKGRRSLDDLMRLMDVRYGRTGKTYTNADLIALASEVAGSDISEFFKQHVLGKRRIRIREWLARAGCDATVSGRSMIIRGPTGDDTVFARMLAPR